MRDRRPLAVQVRVTYRSGLVAALGVLTALAGWGLLARATDLFWCVGLALILVAALDPLVRAVERHGVRRGAAVAAVCVAALATVASALLLVVPPVVHQMTELMARSGELAESGALDAVAEPLQRFVPVGVLDVSATLTQLVDDVFSGVTLGSLSNGVLGVAATVGNALFLTSVVVVLTVYLLAGSRWFLRCLVERVPHGYRRTTLRIVERTSLRVGRYVLGLVALALLNGVLTLVALLLTGAGLPLLFAAVTFLCTLVPLIGIPAGATVTIAAQALMAPEDGTRWVMLGLWYGVYMLLEAYVVAPRVIGRSVELPGVVILLVTLLGAALWGILGALVAVPVAVAVGVARAELSARPGHRGTARPEPALPDPVPSGP